MVRKAGIGAVAVMIFAAAAVPSLHLTVTGDTGQRLWTVPIDPGATVTLVYEHSIYRARTEEQFTATATGFALRGVRSMSEAVLAYNGLEAPYTRAGPWHAAAVSRTLPALDIQIGRTGRQHLIISGRIVPLYEAGEGSRMRVELERAPRGVAALRAWALR